MENEEDRNDGEFDCPECKRSYGWDKVILCGDSLELCEECKGKKCQKREDYYQCCKCGYLYQN